MKLSLLRGGCESGRCEQCSSAGDGEREGGQVGDAGDEGGHARDGKGEREEMRGFIRGNGRGESG